MNTERIDVLAVMETAAKELRAWQRDHGEDRLSKEAISKLREARAAVAELIEKAKDVTWNARMTAPDDHYHEVGRVEMAALIAALARVQGAGA